MKTSIEIISEFDSIVKRLLGIYLDTLMGFQLTLTNIENARNNIAKENDTSIDQMNSYKFRHTTFFSERIHEETLGDFMIRMSKGGRNYDFAGNMCIISIYHYWEDHYRKAIASSLSMNKDDLKSDIMGDIRLLRNSIVHHNSIALKEIERCRLIKLFKENDSIRLSRDNILYAIDNINTYIAKLKSSASKDNDIDEIAHYEIAIVLAKKEEDIKLAEYHFKEAIRINRGFVEAYMDYASLLFTKFNDPKSAKSYYEKAISLSPKHMLARSNYAAFLAMNNEIEEAQENFLKALEIDPHHITTNYNYALVLIRNLKEFEKAKTFLEKALQQDPLNHEILLQYASILRENFKDFKNAELYCKKIIELKADYAEAHNEYGILLMENKAEFSSAEKEFKKAIELKEDLAEPYYNLGNLLFIYTPNVENFHLAKQFYLKAVSIKENYVDAYMNLALLCAYTLGEVELGIDYLQTVINIDPGNDKPYNNLASIYKDIVNNFREANSLYQHAINLNPKNPLAHLNYAQLLGYNLGDKINAKKHYLIAISIDANLVHKEMESYLGV